MWTLQLLLQKLANFAPAGLFKAHCFMVDGERVLCDYR